MTLLQEWVTRAALRRPEATAVVMGGQRHTYEQLDITSNRLAHALRGAGCGRGDRVALLLPKSPTAVVSLLATMKADACYVPLDIASPAARIAKIVASAEPRVILAGARAVGTLRTLLEDARLTASVRLGWLEADGGAGAPCPPAFTLGDVDAMPASLPAYRNAADDRAHILYTSGSTGTPKGVMITHASVMQFVEWARGYFGLAATDRVSGHSPLHFDLSTFDLFGTFAAGAQLHLVPPELNVVPHQLVHFIRDAGLTQWFSVPSVLALMAQLDVVPQGAFPTLKRVLWCGEVFPTRALRYWMTRLPHVTFTNLYGPTEATIASSYYTVPRCPGDDADPVPIGRPCAGEELLVLGDALRPVAPGEIGDLYIRGVGLSPGYWRDPAKTRDAFLPHPTDPRERIYRTGDLARLGADGLILRRARRFADQGPRIPHRAGRNRGRLADSRGARGERGRRAPDRRLRRDEDLLRVRAPAGGGRHTAEPAHGPRQAAPRLHDADALEGLRAPGAERQRQDRSAAH